MAESTLDVVVEALVHNAVFEALAHQRRRYIVNCLGDEPLALADVAMEVAARETDTPLADQPTDVAQHVYISLYHHHVPKLEDAGIVQYDRDKKVVALADHKERLGQSAALLSGEYPIEQ